MDRVVAYCHTVGADISRTEALPVIGKGTAACGEAANHFRNNEFDSAQKAYSAYLKKTLSMCYSLTIADNPIDSSAINRLKKK